MCCAMGHLIKYWHLTAAARAALRAEFAAAAARWRRPDGQIAATLYARLVTAVRR